MYSHIQSDWACSDMEKKAEEFADKYSAEYWCTSSRTGENIEELFTRIAVVAFESVLMREIQITTAASSNGQLESNSALISEFYLCYYCIVQVAALAMLALLLAAIGGSDMSLQYIFGSNIVYVCGNDLSIQLGSHAAFYTFLHNFTFTLLSASICLHFNH